MVTALLIWRGSVLSRGQRALGRVGTRCTCTEAGELEKWQDAKDQTAGAGDGGNSSEKGSRVSSQGQVELSRRDWVEVAGAGIDSGSN